MAQSFNCPNCSAPLDYDGDDQTVRCPYCNSSVIVPESLRAAPRVTAHTPSLPVVGMDTLLTQAGPLKEVVRNIRNGNKIEAIRIYKDTFNVSLADAKDAVDRLAAGQAVSLPGSAPSAPAPGYAPYTSNRVAMARAEISRLVREGKKIEAIKVYRETFGAGLKESKEAVESFEAGGPLIEPLAGSPLSADYGSGSVVTSSSVTSTYTASTQDSKKGSFIGTWVALSFGAFWLGFTVAMLGLFAFPGLVRLAAPVLCPDRYTDAYGERVFNYYDPDSNTSVDGGSLLKCVDNEGQTTVAHPLLVFVVLDAGTWMIGIAIAFGLAAFSRFRVAGCVPLLGVLFVTAIGLYFYVAGIPSASKHGLSSWLFGATSGTASETTTETLASTPAFSLTEVFSALLPTPTPAFAPLTLAIGEGEGTGPGFFNDTRSIAVDGKGNIYTADYSDGRIQVFDADGKFANTWKIAGENVYITGMAADRQGTLYVVYGGNIYQYVGSTGEALGRVAYDDSYVGDVAVTPFGELVAASTSSLVRFDRDGNQVLALDNWSDGLVKDGSLSVDNLAVDGEDNVYIANSSTSAVYKFSPEGKFLDRFGVHGDAPGQFDGLYGLAFDGRGRMYALDYKGVQVFDGNGQYLGLIEIEGLGFDMAMSDQGELLVMDRNANKVLKFKVTP